jgi:putative sigma-54 modulation protein
MKTNIKTSGITLTPAISEYIDKRMSAVDKFVSDDPSAIADIEVGKSSGHHKQGDIFKADIHVVAKNRNLYASSEKSDLYSAIDDIRDEIVRELSSSKEKRVSLMRRGGARVKGIIKGIGGLWS